MLRLYDADVSRRRRRAFRCIQPVVPRRPTVKVLSSRTLAFIVAVTGATACGATLAAQGRPPQTPPEVAAAQAALQAGNADSAIRTLEGYFTRNPNAAVGRLLLGNAYAQKGDLDKAVAAYERVTLPRPAK